LLERVLKPSRASAAVHDLHVWTLTSGLDSMSGHIVVSDMADARRVLETARNLMKEKFGLEHVTIQIEDAALAAEEAKLPV
jgi:cobalt-zinc-cadmium efflux system protein